MNKICYFVGGNIEESLRKQNISRPQEEYRFGSFIFHKGVIGSIDGGLIFYCINEGENTCSGRGTIVKKVVKINKNQMSLF